MFGEEMQLFHLFPRIYVINLYPTQSIYNIKIFSDPESTDIVNVERLGKGNGKNLLEFPFLTPVHMVGRFGVPVIYNAKADETAFLIYKYRLVIGIRTALRIRCRQELIYFPEPVVAVYGKQGELHPVL